MHNIEEILYRLVIVPLVAFLPAPLAYAIARMRGNWYYQLNASKREEMIHNLEMIFGNQMSLAECQQAARDYFRRRSCEAIDVMRLAGSGRALARLVEIRGVEHIKAALAAGKGAIICSAHFGSYNSCFSLLGVIGFPVTTVGDWRSNSDSSMSALQQFLWRLIQQNPLARHRRRSNIEPEKERFGTAMQMVEVLRSNELITMAVETPVHPEDRARAVPVDFLGQQMLLLPGSISVAQLTNAPVLVMVVRRLPDWRHQVVEISAPLALEGDEITVFKRLIQQLETPVRQNLAYWDWLGNTQNLLDLGLFSPYMSQQEIRR
jgi:lauroyl/myristoyl acyltransferase